MATAPQEKNQPTRKDQVSPENRPLNFYRIQFRQGQQVSMAGSRLNNLQKGEVVMVQTEHGKEPAMVVCPMIKWAEDTGLNISSPFFIIRRSTREEISKQESLREMEKNASAVCQEHIARLKLPMNLVNVERYFNGSKIIFYFTAENRVDFRELVKTLVQEFRTRVEMRQIGVRHETKMLGGLGGCGRELCCSSFIQDFQSVSIKMAKEQNLPLNPAKISGACNRLLCCLNYEFDTYKTIRKGMPKIGKYIRLDGELYKVIQQHILQESIVIVDKEGNQQTLTRDKWQAAKPAPPPGS